MFRSLNVCPEHSRKPRCLATSQHVKGLQCCATAVNMEKMSDVTLIIFLNLNLLLSANNPVFVSCGTQVFMCS